MKLNNKRLKRFIPFLYGILIILLTILGLLYNNLFTFNIEYEKIYLSVILITALFYLIFKGLHYYEFDTSGEGLTLIVKRVGPFSFLSRKEKKIDLPKYKINNYELSNGLLNDNLILMVNSKKGKSSIVKVKFDLSISSKVERNIIITELDKIIQQNKLQLESN